MVYFGKVMRKSEPTKWVGLEQKAHSFKEHIVGLLLSEDHLFNNLPLRVKSALICRCIGCFQYSYNNIIRYLRLRYRFACHISKTH